MPNKKQLLYLHELALEIIAAEKAGDADTIAENAVVLARIIDALVAEGVLPDIRKYNID